MFLDSCSLSVSTTPRLQLWVGTCGSYGLNYVFLAGLQGNPSANGAMTYSCIRSDTLHASLAAALRFAKPQHLSWTHRRRNVITSHRLVPSISLWIFAFLPQLVRNVPTLAISSTVHHQSQSPTRVWHRI